MNEQDIIVLDTPEQIEAYRKLTAYHALKLEVKIPGMRMSRGSVMLLIKREYLPDCTKRTKKGVLEEFEALLREEGVLSQ